VDALLAGRHCPEAAAAAQAGGPRPARETVIPGIDTLAAVYASLTTHRQPDRALALLEVHLARHGAFSTKYGRGVNNV
jgi:hypothetical protein